MHQISNSIYKRAYGKKSVFQEKIALAASGDSRLGKTKKELYIMDFDGRRVHVWNGLSAGDKPPDECA